MKFQTVYFYQADPPEMFWGLKITHKKKTVYVGSDECTPWITKSQQELDEKTQDIKDRFEHDPMAQVMFSHAPNYSIIVFEEV